MTPTAAEGDEQHAGDGEGSGEPGRRLGHGGDADNFPETAIEGDFLGGETGAEIESAEVTGLILIEDEAIIHAVGARVRGGRIGRARPVQDVERVDAGIEAGEDEGADAAGAEVERGIGGEGEGAESD